MCVRADVFLHVCLCVLYSSLTEARFQSTQLSENRSFGPESLTILIHFNKKHRREKSNETHKKITIVKAVIARLFIIHLFFSWKMIMMIIFPICQLLYSSGFADYERKKKRKMVLKPKSISPPPPPKRNNMKKNLKKHLNWNTRASESSLWYHLTLLCVL